MPDIVLDYPHSAATAAPEGLELRHLLSLAHAVRAHIVMGSLERMLDVEGIVERCSAFRINGVRFAVEWDLDHAVNAEGNVPVMGMTEFDPVEPSSIMVSVNGEILGQHRELMRSTVAHELGHVVFDAPGWVRQGAGLRAVNFAETPGADGGKRHAQRYDPREVRANEFMGALLVPPNLLRVDFVRLAKRHRLQASNRPSAMVRGAPAYDGAMLEGDAISEVLVELAERYGLTETFMRVRLDRYDLLRTRKLYHVV